MINTEHDRNQTPRCHHLLKDRHTPTQGQAQFSCFNHENYIEDALNGFLMQKTDFPWEVIIHDDASTDNSAAIIKAYAERYPSIIKPIFQEENQYRKGLKPTYFTTGKARGRFYAFCEGDDYWLDNRKLQLQADFLIDNPEYSVCGHDAFIFEGNEIVRASKLPESKKADAKRERLAKGWFILPLTAMYRSNFDVFPEEHSKIHNGDTFLFSRLGKIGGYKYISELAPAAYQVHQGGVWSSVDEKQRLNHKVNTMYWISQYYKRVGDKDLSIHYGQWSSLLALEAVGRMSFLDFAYFIFKASKIYFRNNSSRLYRFIRAMAKYRR